MLPLVVFACGLNFAHNKKKTKLFPSWDAWIVQLFVVSCWCVKTVPGKDCRAKRRSPPSSHLLQKKTCSSKAPNGKLQKINLVLSGFIEYRRKTTLKCIWLPIMCKHLSRDTVVWLRCTSCCTTKSSWCGKLGSFATWGSSTSGLNTAAMTGFFNLALLFQECSQDAEERPAPSVVLQRLGHTTSCMLNSWLC